MKGIQVHRKQKNERSEKNEKRYAEYKEEHMKIVLMN